MSSSTMKSAVPFARAAGFTLIELLSVIAIVSILAVTTMPAIRGTLDGVTISGAAGVVESELSFARQVAMSRNLPVEVRFYKYDDGNGIAWRAVASVIPASVSGAKADEWLSRAKVLPGNVVADDSQEYSTLISRAVASSSTNEGPWTATESSAAPGILRGKSYVGFQFRPDGSINLPNGQPWCVTLRSSTSRQSGSAPADNYVSIVLDSLTGRTMSYQP